MIILPRWPLDLFWRVVEHENFHSLPDCLYGQKPVWVIVIVCAGEGKGANLCLLTQKYFSCGHLLTRTFTHPDLILIRTFAHPKKFFPTRSKVICWFKSYSQLPVHLPILVCLFVCHLLIYLPIFTAREFHLLIHLPILTLREFICLFICLFANRNLWHVFWMNELYFNTSWYDKKVVNKFSLESKIVNSWKSKRLWNTKSNKSIE